MRENIKKRIEAVCRGEVPEGYAETTAGCIPADWSSAALSEISLVLHEQAGDRDFETLSISAGIGFVNQAEKFGKELSGKQYTKYTVLRRGDFAYNKGNSKRYPQGCTYMLRERDEAAVPNVFECFRITQGHPEYYEQLFINGFMNKQLTRKINHGVRDDGLLNLTDDDFYSTIFPVPPIAEQQKIAEILATCDRVIELKQKLLEEKRRQKQWLMQKLLDPNSGVRLPGYTAPWKLCTLGNIMNITSVKRIHQSDWTDNGVRFLRARDIVAAFNDEEPEDYLFISRDKYDEYSAISGKVSVGDLLVTGVGSIGVPYLVRDNNPLYFKDGNVIWFQNQGRIEGDYFYYAFSGSAIQNYIRDSAGIGTVGTYTIESGKKTPIWLPSTEEQKAIANVINNADQEVALCKKELEAWQEKKKSLMQLLLTGLVRVNA